MASSRPPSPPFGKGYFSVPFERFVRDESFDLTSAFTLLDTVETYFDSHVDLLQRKLQKHSDRLKLKAEETFKIKDLKLKDLKIKDLSGDLLADNLEREIRNFKLKLSTRVASLSTSWQSAKVVRTREKVSFFIGVMTLLGSALMFGMAPQWVHVAYTVLGLYLLPLRFYQYKKRAWHYFLFDLCYYVTILNFVYFWLFPSSPALFVACYCLSHGSLASAVITWRNSLVFHDQDKVTSLFIHIYAPFSFTVIRHFYPNAEARFPALKRVGDLNPLQALILSGAIYAIWQILYWKFLLVDRRAKIESGQRTTSFSFLLNDKRGAIGRMLSAVPPPYREASFMGGQFIYAILTELPAVFLLYHSSFWSAMFLLAIFSVSVWNGGGFYIEVFGRKFERELEALRKEIAESSARSTSGTSGASTPGTLSRGASHTDLLSLNPQLENLDLLEPPSESSSNSTPSVDESKKDI
ncbi:Glycerophosphocholine acyltransferase 1 [Psilocybe cubensis]|uniref:Glycerophosphocholine acyltransferase 1 n=2 Tax=Psilocybe cubensis TaxID=181762 RepID=A0ACB8H4P2_PSICU|nr:Glycerophosphocholine acyltransferase 1 [Psilocybe cubensis]KAH9482888.1 Glycerophosphocholine acyltransferase 1 [Psilocybe cubensis]